MAYNRYLHVKEVRDKYHEAILKQRSHSVMRRMEESRDFNDTVFELMYDSESDTTIQQVETTELKAEETEKIPEYTVENEVTDNET